MYSQYGQNTVNSHQEHINEQPCTKLSILSTFNFGLILLLIYLPACHCFALQGIGWEKGEKKTV